MDILAHGLWSNILVYKKFPKQPKLRFVAVLFGILPDLIPFAPLFIYMIFKRLQFWDVIGLNHWTVLYAPEAYNFTHSFVIFLCVFLIVTILRKGRIYWPMLAWFLHILMDLFTHPDFYRTPFLFPISHYKISFGLSWGHPAIMIPQYLFFAVWYLWWFLRGRKQAKVNE